MNGINQLARAKNLLGQAISVANNSLPNNRSVAEARQHMTQAMKKIDKATNEKIQKKRMSQDQFENWWGNVQSGTAALAAQPMSAEANQKSLNNLNSMIEEEQKKIDDIENADQGPDRLIQE